MLLAVHYRVMEHAGSLESTQEARLLRFFRALQTSFVLHNSIVHTKAFMELWFCRRKLDIYSGASWNMTHESSDAFVLCSFEEWKRGRVS